MMRWAVALWAALALAAAAQAAGLPAAYAPLVVQPSGVPQRYEFDLRPALERARKEGKRLYVYLGAHDCPFCRKYEAFLDRNAKTLAPQFAKDWLVVDLRSALAGLGERLFFRTGDAPAVDYFAFQRALGDQRTRQVVYPSVWLFDATPKTLMQMPAGTGTFETVDEQLEILQFKE